MTDTIVAIATPPGRGGIGIVRLSGDKVSLISNKLIIGDILQPRKAQLCNFVGSNNIVIDTGLAIFFPAPNSFTGENLLELHGHGSPVVMDMLLRRILELGARMARSGEFSERAFLNNKLDLVQAESIAQLIASDTEQQAIAAQRSLRGEFSKIINIIVEKLTKLRVYIEASIDFPDETIDLLQNRKFLYDVESIKQELDQIEKNSTKGMLLTEGVNVVIIGKSNVGKSTLFNSLTGENSAIVTSIAGTTRDTIKCKLNFDGLQINIIDTAGLRNTIDPIEKIGIIRSWEALDLADLVLLVVDCEKDVNIIPTQLYPQLQNKKILVVYNKIDKLKIKLKINKYVKFNEIYISAAYSIGLSELKSLIKDMVNAQHIDIDNVYIARRRHLTALNMAKQHIDLSIQQLSQINIAEELIAEELRIAQQYLEEITGKFTNDELLDKIFSEFCIGK